MKNLNIGPNMNGKTIASKSVLLSKKSKTEAITKLREAVDVLKYFDQFDEDEVEQVKEAMIEEPEAYMPRAFYLPDMLDNSRARRAFVRLVDAGLLTFSNGQLVANTTVKELAMIAHAMRAIVFANQKVPWSAFEKLFLRNNLRQSYNQAITAKEAEPNRLLYNKIVDILR